MLGDAADFTNRTIEILGQTAEDAATLNWGWHLPPDLKKSRLQEFERAMATQLACDRWTRMPMELLDGKTPADVAADLAYRPQLLALINQFEIGDRQHPYNMATVDAVRERLGCPRCHDRPAGA